MLGQFQSVLTLEYMEKFRQSLKLGGTSNTFCKERLTKKRGVECSKEDFQPEYQFVENDNYEIYQRKKGLSYQASQSNPQNTLTLTKSLQMYQSSENADLFEKFMDNQRNRNKYDSFLKNQRQSRMRSEQQAVIRTKIAELQEKNKLMTNTDRRKVLDKLPYVFN